MKGYVPKLQAAHALDETLIRIFRYCTTTWAVGATADWTAVRQELIDLSNQWGKLILLGPCPYLPTKEEVAKHQQLYEDLEDAAGLKSAVMRILGANSDGCVPNNLWERAETLLPQLRCQWIESAIDSGTSKEEANRMFPFDGN
jgi:hypothetical protein